jgi:hypothetical protein
MSCTECHNDTTLIVSKQAQFKETSVHGTGESFLRGEGTNCAGCHGSEGVKTRINAGLPPHDPSVEGVTNVSPINCRTCHNIHTTYTIADFSLTGGGQAVKLEYTDGTFDGGQGNLCAQCHQIRNPEPEIPAGGEFAVASNRFGPHYGVEAQMLLGDPFPAASLTEAPGVAHRKFRGFWRFQRQGGRVVSGFWFFSLPPGRRSIHYRGHEPTSVQGEGPGEGVDVRLDVDTRQLSGVETITYANRSDTPIPDLVFHLYLNAFRDQNSLFMRESGGMHRGFGWSPERAGWIEIEALRVQNGPELSLEPLEDGTLARAVLPQPVAPGQSITLQVEFRAQLPGIFARTGWALDAAGQPFFMVGQWFPKLGVWQGARGWNAYPLHANSEFFADFGDYDVTIHLPRLHRRRDRHAGWRRCDRQRQPVAALPGRPGDRLRLDGLALHPRRRPHHPPARRRPGAAVPGAARARLDGGARAGWPPRPPCALSASGLAPTPTRA